MKKLQLVDVIKQLRGNKGCPWNMRQMPSDYLSSIKAELDELETAIYSGELWNIRDELGDVLFNLLSLVEYYSELNLIDLEDVDSFSSAKMIRRHPYVFGGESDPGPVAAKLQWQEIKRQEQGLLRQMYRGRTFSYHLSKTKFNNFFQIPYQTVCYLHDLMHGRSNEWPAHVENIGTSYLAFSLHVSFPAHTNIIIDTNNKEVMVTGFTTYNCDFEHVQEYLITVFDPGHYDCLIVPFVDKVTKDAG